MERDEYNRLRAVINESHRRALEELEQIWQTSRHRRWASTLGRKPIGRPKGRVEWMVSKAIQEIKHKGSFTARDVDGAMRRMFPEDTRRILLPTVSVTLSRMARGRLLDVVDAGMGRKPSTYAIRPDRSDDEKEEVEQPDIRY